MTTSGMGKNVVVFLKEEYLIKKDKLKEKGIDFSTLVKEALDIYYGAEFEPKEPPKELMKKIKILLQKNT
jgi:hypothetical protein